MTNKFLFASCLLLLLLLNVARVECRGVAAGGVAKSGPKGGGHSERLYKLFVFGDDYADVGNRPDDGEEDKWSRIWHYPFGMSDTHHDKKPTGRYSNGMVQSDYLARILGYDESPPAYSLKGDEGIGSSGMNFANSSATLLGSGDHNEVKAIDQVEQLSKMIHDDLISERDLKHSVALVAYSGNDYAGLAVDDISDDLIGRVTEGIAEVVRELQGIGVRKVLVNSVPPLGCQPWSIRFNKDSQCDDDFNTLADKHNAALLDALPEDKDVLLLDINAMFTEIIIPKDGSTLSKQFENTASPCCESLDTDDGYCGQTNEQGEQQFSVCDNPERYFYWDDKHPTQAGWKAVMQLLQGPIMAFLGISNLNHL